MDGSGCAFDNNGRALALLTPDGRLKIWDCTAGSLRHEYTPPSHLSSSCTCLKWSRTSRFVTTQRRKKSKTSRQSESSSASNSIALGTSSGDVLLYGVTAGEVDQKLEGGHDSRVNDLCWSDDDGALFSCSNDKHITEWNTGNGQRKCKWKADKHGVRCMRLGPKGNTLLSAGRSIKLWDLATKEALKKFTGHASPVTHLQFIPSNLSHDSNANHIPSNGINGQYFLSGAEQDRLINVWYINLDSQDKNALVSLSITDEPIAVDVIRHSNRDKDGTQPLAPVLCVHLLSEGEPEALIAYGSRLKPQFETLAYSTMEEHTCLVRESSSNLLLNDSAHEPYQIDKGKASSSQITTLGPGNMTRATPAMVLDDGRTKLKRKAEHEKKESLEEQSIEDRLKAINAEAAETSRRRGNDRPTADSLAQMLIQALHSQDNSLMELVHKIQAAPGRGEGLVLWIKHILSTHMAYLMTVPDLVDSLSGLYAMLESRVSVFSKLCKLQGRLDLMLSQVDSQSHNNPEEEEHVEPTVVYQEEDSDEEPLVPIEAEHSESDENWDQDEEEEESEEDSDNENEIEVENESEDDESDG
ncbi:WD repeat-containing protein 43 [Stylophora pistillata]|uniref:WD repeat-containing protein 43 n=1 Tax=Stylophora pistillata TaxID=50429 RepID=A0A2B4RWJ3_STYPI|nr:WD repeat-containing protein 43 [Stylophora pistillata]